MTKQDIVDYLYNKVGFPKTELEEIVDETFSQIKSAVLGEGRVKLPGFGNFEVRYRKPRRGRNPQTGEEMTISGRKSLVFKPSPALKKALNP
jgi:integration host factor subunit alpha